MDNNCIKTLSVWTDTFKVPEFDSLKENINADVCIVGAGISGITCAYLLASEGKKVVIIDDGIIGGGETGNTTAHITSVIDDRFSRIEKLHGIDRAQMASQSQRNAIFEIERIINKENIQCDFKKVEGYLFFKADDKIFTEEYEAAMRAGMEVEISDSPLSSFKDYKTLKFAGQAQFHVLKYIASLANAITKMNGKIFTGTFVNDIEDSKEQVIIKTGKVLLLKPMMQ
ncbi:MAG: FAD-binding oxidoreductase [Ignavibacteria bacterium]|nr:FAD-binding oxidoreductase [Ignavibacteria bacterium]